MAKMFLLFVRVLRFLTRLVSRCNGVGANTSKEKYVFEWFRNRSSDTIPGQLCPNGLGATDFPTNLEHLLPNGFQTYFSEDVETHFPNGAETYYGTGDVLARIQTDASLL